MGHQLYIKHIFGTDVLNFMQQEGSWVIVNIEQTFGWPKDDLLIKIDGRTLALLSTGPEGRFLPAVASIAKSEKDTIELTKFIYEFLSRLNWVLGGSIRIESTMGGSTPIRTTFQGKVNYTSNNFRIPFLPANLSDEVKIALALYREGKHLMHVHNGYSFLSFFKIINMVNSIPKKQKDWIKNNFVKIRTDEKVEEWATQIENAGENIEDYLYVSCRCAIAHAGLDPTINPDDPNDARRLRKDLPIMQKLAKIIMVENFGLLTKRKYFESHLYELYGFKEIIGSSLISRLNTERVIPRRQLEWPNRISLRLWPDKRFDILENLKVTTKFIQDRRILIACRSETGHFIIQLLLDFHDERLHLILDEVVVPGLSDLHSIKQNIQWKQFYHDYLMNGELEIWESSSDVLLGRKDAYLPLNIDLNATSEAIKSEIESLEHLLSEKSSE